MSNFAITRRAALGAVGALVVAPPILLQGAAAQPHGPYGNVHVDVAPLLENSGEPTAAWVAQLLPGALAQAFASVGRAGVPVSVRIDYVILGPNSGGAEPGGSAPDQMIGEVTVGGVTRPLRATTSYYPMAVDQPEIERANYGRIRQLAEAFAYWAARGY